MDDVLTRVVETRTHGRYLIRSPRGQGPWPLLVGFHGYRESAAAHLAALERISGTERWLLVAVQALHRFYPTGGPVVARWRPHADRARALADTVAYVGRVLDAVQAEFTVTGAPVFVGFSQGVAMAFRAAAHIRASAVIVAGADVPPDVAAGTSVPLPGVLYGRGHRDDLYTADHHSKDVASLHRLGVAIESVAFDGGHELSPAFLDAASRRIATLSARV